MAAACDHFKSKVLGCADGDLQRAADFQPSKAVAHFIKAGSLPAGLTAHQLAQVCKEAKETFDSQAECNAARLVVRCMYEGGLTEEVKDPLTLDTGQGGQACSKEQKQQLSCLVRVQHLSPGKIIAFDAVAGAHEAA
ncbi:hypothetical protein HaLaN_24161 [Haematococcus lacustris]|uniref:Uncharacterized protein n=1 Tax=Haematococcus lacustris TaxID=44745 RepID=A0A6A0A253_HAELA|nr:hypothetical protein HaLaN_24161 [Haematococcus lacustris]